MRLPWPAVASGTLVLALGAAGLVVGATPQSPASDSGTSANPITVTGAYVRPPAPPTELAGAYFTIRNNTSSPDTLVSVQTGAGADAVLHSTDASGAMNATSSAVVPANGTLTLSVGKAHVMISKLFGPLKAGSDVNISLQFENAGPVDVVAPVVPYGQPAPTGVVK